MDIAAILKFFLALIGVVALIAALPYLGRKVGKLSGWATERSGRRLTLVESVGIDAKRKLLLVRRDDVEHLVLLGAGSETVIERGIPAKQQGKSQMASAGETPAEVTSLSAAMLRTGERK
jgi:flagellar protein FliO/FliZ